MSRRKRSRTTRPNKSKDHPKAAVSKTNKEHLGALLNWLLPDDSIFSRMHPHGNTKWLPQCLNCLAHVLGLVGGEERDGRPQGLMGALVRWTPTLMAILWPVLQRRMANGAKNVGLRDSEQILALNGRGTVQAGTEETYSYIFLPQRATRVLGVPRTRPD